MITSTKRYVSIVPLPINYNIMLSEHLKQRPERTLSWNKYRS